MAADEKIKKYGIVFVGLLLGGGFAFGGIASYSGMVNTGSSSNGDRQEFRTTPPSASFSDGPYNLSLREQRALAANYNSVFVTLLYENSSERQEFLSYRGVEDRFQGRMFIQVVSKTENPQYQNLGRNVDPEATFIGGARGESGVQAIEDVNEDRIVSSGCSVLATWNPSNGPSLTSLCSR